MDAAIAKLSVLTRNLLRSCETECPSWQENIVQGRQLQAVAVPSLVGLPDKFVLEPICPVRAFTTQWPLVERLRRLRCGAEYCNSWCVVQLEARGAELWLSRQSRKGIAGTAPTVYIGAFFAIISIVAAHGRDPLDGEKRWHRRKNRPRN